MNGLARLMLVGGPFDGHEAAGLPPDTHPPAQIVWSGWVGGQFTAWLYEWRGETTVGGFRPYSAPTAVVDALIYRTTGRRLTPDEIPPAISDLVEQWADAADLLIKLTSPPKRGGARWGDL